MRNNLTRVEKIVIIVTIVAVFMVFSGIGYAFFTVNNPAGSTALITNTSGKMTITYADGGSDLLVSDKITPSNTIIADKTFTLTGLNTATAGNGIKMSYKVGLTYTSSFSDGQIHYYIKRTTTNSNVTSTFIGTANQTIPGNTSETGYTTGTLKKGNRYHELVTGEFLPNNNAQTITFNLKLQFPDTNTNQDSEKGKSLTAMIEINHESITADYIADLDLIDNGLEVDDTDDLNLRYTGANPKNYIFFNDELWRIIGTFNVYNNDIKREEKLVKIVRNEILGNYSWDSSDSSVNSGQGINEWSQADLMKELNNDYIDTTKTSGTTIWYNGQNNLKNANYDYGKNIKSGYINKIANVRWNLGLVTYGSSAINTYNQERGKNHISNPSDGIARTDTWNGKIALMYPSDYGYASTDLMCRNNLSSTNCKNNNWLVETVWYWFLSPSITSSSHVFYYSSSGIVTNSDGCAFYAGRIYPSLFLTSNVKITSGTGTSENPYRIA